MGVFVLGACATFVRNVAVNLAGERIAARYVVIDGVEGVCMRREEEIKG